MTPMSTASRVVCTDHYREEPSPMTLSEPNPASRSRHSVGGSRASWSVVRGHAVDAGIFTDIVFCLLHAATSVMNRPWTDACIDQVAEVGCRRTPTAADRRVFIEMIWLLSGRAGQHLHINHAGNCQRTSKQPQDEHSLRIWAQKRGGSDEICYKNDRITR